MSETSFASLNPSLLARKGGAKPAMRPQLTPINPAANLDDLGWNDMGDEEPAPHTQDAEVLHLTPEPANAQAEAEARKLDRAAEQALAETRHPEVLKQQAELATRVAQAPKAETPVPEPVPAEPPAKQPVARTKAPKRRSALDRGKRAAFTLRLDAERHLKLRLAATVKGRSAQQIVTEALDLLLEDMPEINSLAAQVQQR